MRDEQDVDRYEAPAALAVDHDPRHRPVRLGFASASGSGTRAIRPAVIRDASRSGFSGLPGKVSG
jgi:hypothetical protein